MKKQKIMRMYNLSDADLVVKGKEKISFMRRDKAAFAAFGITTAMIAGLETSFTSFSENVTDVEALNDQIALTEAKNAKGEELRTAVRNVMKHAELVFGVRTARYKQFGTKGLIRQNDSELFITGKVVVQASTIHMQELTGVGFTAAMLNTILLLCHDFEKLVYEQKNKIWERSALKENRIMEGNLLYVALVKYTTIGFTIWETTNAAKYNDYITYDRVAAR
jgi:cell division protein FtsB